MGRVRYPYSDLAFLQIDPGRSQRAGDQSHRPEEELLRHRTDYIGTTSSRATMVKAALPIGEGQPPMGWLPAWVANRLQGWSPAKYRGGQVAARLRQGSSIGAATSIGSACGHNTREQLPTGRSTLARRGGACPQEWRLRAKVAVREGVARSHELPPEDRDDHPWAETAGCQWRRPTGGRHKGLEFLFGKRTFLPFRI
ncbi:hypothetical protein BHM03_00014991 [Ensete ventricosum]|uniref:Uncharacterized protein n=1 Tax=Ensete ventricosum TaxID=4639 RepID=A0A445MEJ4_ENSVE|nr:hypothetical protein BHM03_00014991 [Ensete ventricosum]